MRILDAMDTVLIFDYAKGVVIPVRQSNSPEGPMARQLAEREPVPTSAAGSPPPRNAK